MKYKNSFQKGQAVMISFLMFLGVSVAIIFAFADPVLNHLQIARSAYDSKESYYAAEALAEDMMFRLNNSMNVSPTESLTIDGHSAEAVFTDAISTKEIVSTGNSNGFERTIKVNITTGEGASFSYGVQTGNGGFIMANNAQVNGNVYSNGDITGGTITGTAIAANSSSVITDQVNDTPTPPTNDINFRNVAATQDFAQSFITSTTSAINKIQFYMKKVGAPANATIRIVTNSSGSPSTSNILTTNGTLNSSLVTNNYGWVEVVFPSNPILTAGTTYWFVIDNSTQSASNYYVIGGNTGYGSGNGKVGAYGGTWNDTSPAGLDGYFKLYLGGIPSTISNVVVGEDAWAHAITGGSVGGVKYCQVGTGCDTSRADPSPVGFPLSDAQIDAWKAVAEAGGVISGNYSPTGTSSTLGPKKITGNLTFPGNHDLTLTGTVWVTGNIILHNNNSIALASSYGDNSGIIIADGRFSFDNNVDFYGSGNPGSNVMTLTTSDCPDSGSCSGYAAIEILNNVGENSNDVLYNAQNGTIHFSNNASAKEATANTLLLDNNVVITYETGLVNVNFTSGPTGAWGINTWQEVE